MDNKVHLKGLGMTRDVFIGNKKLQPVEGAKFDWGYKSMQGRGLMIAILNSQPNEELRKHLDELYEAIIPLLPSGNFDVIINFDKYLEWLSTSSDKKRNVYSLVDVHIGNSIYVSKYIDFPNLNIKTAELRSDTIEFHLLNKLTKEQFSTYEEYIKENTKSPTENPKITSRADIGFIVGIDDNSYYEYSKGLGSKENFNGFKATAFDH